MALSTRRSVEQEKIIRVLDANFNRAQEGLRVCEDISRFILDQESWTKQYKDLRHELSLGQTKMFRRQPKAIKFRDIQADVGKGSTALELKRRNVQDVFLANSQRVKESLRVLEEFAKLMNSRLAVEFKSIRYQLYALERKVAAKF